MSPAEQMAAIARSYTQAEDMLCMERLILAVMQAHEPRSSPALSVQQTRVNAIERIVASFGRDLAAGAPGKVSAKP